MTLSECRSKSQFNDSEKWDQKNLDDQLMRIFTETVSMIQNFHSRKVGTYGRSISDGDSSEWSLFKFQGENISLSERGDIRTERTQMDTGCARTTHVWNSAKGITVQKLRPMWPIFVSRGLIRPDYNRFIYNYFYITFCVRLASDYSSVGRAGDCRG